jgi:hypothetical protein
MTRSAKHWCFTLNNYSNDDKQHLSSLFNSLDACVYLVYGEEVGDNGTPHLQGFVSFSSRKTLNYCRQQLSSSAHFEVARGTPVQAADYCKKDGAFTELGVLPAGRGDRSDLRSLAERIHAGATQQEIETEFPAQFIRYRSNILATIRERVQPRDPASPPTVIVLWGRSGAGKTRTIFDYHNANDIWVHGSGKWFDGYHGQQVALFDDYTGSEFKLGFLLKLIDRYPMRVEVKGDFVQWRPSKIYFTSNKDPQNWYPNVSDEHRNALFRRFSQVQHFE